MPPPLTARWAALLDRHLAWMAAAGTTTAEVKSGYGLDRDTELAMLDAAGAGHPIEVAPTFLGAHAVGPEWDDADAYLTFVIEQVLPQAAGRAEAADVFLERGAFDRDQAERYLRAAADARAGPAAARRPVQRGGRRRARRRAGRALGRPPRGDRPRGVAALAASDVAAVLLPACVIMLDLPRPPARELADAGAIVALATDFNPGSAFCHSLPLVMSLACMQLGMSPAEALVACTVNAAWVLGRGERLGRIAPGYDGDVVLLDSDDWRHAAYHLGGPAVAARDQGRPRAVIERARTASFADALAAAALGLVAAGAGR